MKLPGSCGRYRGPNDGLKPLADGRGWNAAQSYF
jgi:hypothetical protein